MPATTSSVEVRKRGRWVAIPVMEVNGDKLMTRGRWLKIARVRGEEMRENELEDPQLYVEALKKKRIES